MLKSKSIKTFLFIVVCAGAGMLIPRFLCISETDSMKYHLFVLRPFQTGIQTGIIVSYPHSDAVTNNKTISMLKRVACSAGQHLKADATNREYYCDGKYLARAKTHSAKGVPVQNFLFDGLIPEGKFFALAPHIDSYDSRYYGLVDTSSVTGVFYPLL